MMNATVRVKLGPLVHTRLPTPPIRKPSRALVGCYVKVPWKDTLLVAEVIRYNERKKCNTLRYFRAWADKEGGSYFDEFEYPAYLATDVEVAAAQAEQEAVDAVETTREDAETNGRKRRKVDITEVARTLLTLSGDETTAPPVDDETSPLA